MAGAAAYSRRRPFRRCRDGTTIDIVGAVETASEKTWSENASPDRG
jgi:hypothetical protein